MATVSTPTKRTRESLVLRDVDWQTYTRMLRAFAERPTIRLTYDRGSLEIMSPSLVHDSPSDLLGAFVRVLTEEMGLPIKGGGSTTLRKRKKLRGIESDRCYWIGNEPRMRGKLQLNLRVDPPPDLAIETDVTNSSLNRMGIYAALRVPEVWRLEGQSLTFHVLGPDHRYTELPTSPTFPFVTPADLLHHLALADQMDENAVVRQVRAWVRQQLAARGTPPPASP